MCLDEVRGAHDSGGMKCVRKPLIVNTPGKAINLNALGLCACTVLILCEYPRGHDRSVYRVKSSWSHYNQMATIRG